MRAALVNSRRPPGSPRRPRGPPTRCLMTCIPAYSPLARTDRRSERGAMILIVAILAVLVFGFIGLAVDSSHVASAAGQLQDAADAAALAATHSLAAEAPLGGSQGTYAVTRQKAIDVAAQNIAGG